MNNIARVIGSVVLLGACAAAMRFTMQTVEIPHAQRKLHTARIDTSKAKKIEVQLGISATRNFWVKPSVAGRIASTYSATAASRLLLIDATKNTTPNKKGSTFVDYEIGMDASIGFLGTRPDTFGEAELRLPKNVPLDITTVIDDFGLDSVNTNFDLRGLDIQDFSLMHSARFNIVMQMPSGSPKATFFVRNNQGGSRIYFDDSSQGNMTVETQQGIIDVKTNPKLAIQIMVVGKATSPMAFRERILGSEGVQRLQRKYGTSNPELVWDEPKPHMFPEYGYYMIGNSKTTSKTPFKLFLILLGEKARVSIQ